MSALLASARKIKHSIYRNAAFFNHSIVFLRNTGGPNVIALQDRGLLRAEFLGLLLIVN
jgi:hypothetical protein